MSENLTIDRREKLIRALLNFDNRSREDVAKDVGVDPRTIYRWLEAAPDIWDEVYERARESTAEIACDSLRELRRIIKRGRDNDKLTAIKMLWQYRGELVDRSENKSDINLKVEAVISEDDARRLATALLACGKKR